MISIHVLRVEDDRLQASGLKNVVKISIHVLRVEDDHCAVAVKHPRFKFQSTSSVWRTTDVLSVHGVEHPISIHVLRVEDDSRKTGCYNISSISIHVLRVEDDTCQCTHLRPASDFNPRPPCGGRPHLISNPVLHAEFQSTSSVWRTTSIRISSNSDLAFQSTSSVWRTTAPGCVDLDAETISIHVLRVEDDTAS